MGAVAAPSSPGGTKPFVTTSIVASTAPHRAWPSTMRRVLPKVSAEYSMLPMSIGSGAVFPATRTTKRSPRPSSKHDLRREARIRAREDDREGPLALGDLGASNRVAARALDGALHEALVAGQEPSQRLVAILGWPRVRCPGRHGAARNRGSRLVGQLD